MRFGSRSTERREQMQSRLSASPEGDKLFMYDRWNRIVGLLKPDTVTSVDELASKLDVSQATIRRDLSELDEAGRLKRVRGGAVAKASDDGGETGGGHRILRGQLDQSLSMVSNTAAKKAIGRKAATLIDDGEAIIIDGGTTTFELANNLENKSLTVLTTSILIMNALLRKPHIRTVIAGGEIFHEQSIILNPYSNGIVSKFSATKLLIGAQAITSRGLMQTDPLLVHNEQELITRAENVIVLADSSKFGAKGSLSVCGLDVIDMIVTDDGVDDSVRSMLADHEIELITVSAGAGA